MIDERAKMIVAKNATAIPKTLLAIALVELLDGSSIANTMSETEAPTSELRSSMSCGISC
jgi:hypothetical protein